MYITHKNLYNKSGVTVILISKNASFLKGDPIYTRIYNIIVFKEFFTRIYNKNTFFLWILSYESK